MSLHTSRSHDGSIPPRPRVFISYARDDAKEFVSRLRRDLERDIDVWWDKVAMESRGQTFLQVLRDAIESVDRLVAVIGPKALESDYVRCEWEHAALFDKGIVPVLRIGEYESIPAKILPADDGGLSGTELAKLHCVDFRKSEPYEKALEELRRLLAQPAVRLAAILGVPALPAHFLPRLEPLAGLRASVLADLDRPTVLGGPAQTTVIHGMGGLGKSVLAAAFARTIDTRRAFEHGIHWLEFGESAGDAEVLSNARALGRTLGGKGDFSDLTQAKSGLARLLADSCCLVVLDDIWSMEHIEPFRNAIGSRCRILVTTRWKEIATSLEAQSRELEPLEHDGALELLSDWVGTIPEERVAVAEQLIAACGGLPLALAMVGAMVRDHGHWEGILERLRSHALDKVRRQLPNYPDRSLLGVIEVSACALENTTPRYLELAAIPDDAAMPEAALQELWAHAGLNPLDVAETCNLLVSRSLAKRDGSNRLMLHGLQKSYVNGRIEDDALVARRRALGTWLASLWRPIGRSSFCFTGPKDMLV